MTKLNERVKSKKEDKRLKPIVQLTLEGEYIAEFTSIREASVTLGINYSSIAQCVSEYTKTCMGYIFMKKEDYGK